MSGRNVLKHAKASSLDEAYSLYVKIHGNKAPTASRLKKFINEDDRVHMVSVDFVTCDRFLKQTGLGRPSSGLSSDPLVVNAAGSKSSHARHKSPAPAKKPKLSRSQSTAVPPQDQPVRGMSGADQKKTMKHYRQTKSVDLDKPNKSRREKQVMPSLAALSESTTATLKPSSIHRKKNGKKSGSRKEKKTSGTLKPSLLLARNSSKNSSMKKTSSSSKTASKSKNMERPKLRGKVYDLVDDDDPLPLPGDAELAQLLNEIPSSPSKSPRKQPSSNSSSMHMSSILPIPTDDDDHYPTTSQMVDLDAVNATLLSFPFVEHLSADELKKVRVQHQLDHRSLDGKFLTATVLQINGPKYRLRYDRYGPKQTTHDVWSDAKRQLYRFAKHHSMTLRPAHRMVEAGVGDAVDCNPRRVSKKGHRGWKRGSIAQKDYKSGQIKVEYAVTTSKSKSYFWTHLDNVEEIAPSNYMLLLGRKTTPKTVAQPAVSPTPPTLNGNANRAVRNGHSRAAVAVAVAAAAAAAAAPPEDDMKYSDVRNMYGGGSASRDSNDDDDEDEDNRSVIINEDDDKEETGAAAAAVDVDGDDGVRYFSMDKFKGLNLNVRTSNGQSGKANTLQLPTSSGDGDEYESVNEWTAEHVLLWLGRIDRGQFANDAAYAQMRASIRKWKITGSELWQFNHVFLRMLGVADEHGRELILSAIGQLEPTLDDLAFVGHVRKLSQMEIEQGIEQGLHKATRQHKQEKQKMKTEIDSLQKRNLHIQTEHSTKLAQFSDLQQLYAKMQKEKRTPAKELKTLQQQNEEMSRKVAALTQTLGQHKKTVKSKDAEIAGLQRNVRSLQTQVTQKEDKISALKSKKNAEITELKKQLKIAAENYEKLNVEYSAQQQQIEPQIEPQATKPELRSGTKDSASEHRQQQRMMNGHSNGQKKQHAEEQKDEQQQQLSSMQQREDTAETWVESDTASLQSANSMDDNTDNNHTQTFDDDEEYKTVIIDNGSETIKIGYGTAEAYKPSKKFPAIIATPKKHLSNTHSSVSDDEFLIGDEAFSKSSTVNRSIYNVHNVIQRGSVTDWDMAERMWRYALHKKLNLPSDNAQSLNVLMTESVLTRKEHREKSTQMFFETFDVNSLYMVNEGVLSLYGTGKATGCVLGIGHGVTYSTAIYESMIIPNSTIRVNSAGFDLSTHLRQLLSHKYPTLMQKTPYAVLNEMKHRYCFTAPDFTRTLKEKQNTYKKYQLPDGQCIRIATERFAVCEQLFGGFMNLNHETMNADNKKLFTTDAQFDKSGIQHMVQQSIKAVNDDDIAREFYGNVVLSGGTTMFKGLPQRLQMELNTLCGAQQPVTVVANEKRKYLAWIGASVISSLTHFQQQFIHKSEYDEHGPNIVHKKCIQ